MGEVRPLEDRPPAPEPVAPLPRRVDEDAEALRELSELVDGRAPFNLADTDDFIEGAIADLDPRVRRRLRQGRFSNQAHVDLHGFTQDEAKAELERFLLESHRRGHRCVLVVHGRGLHSKDGIPVLKERMKVWLTQGRLARRVLGFCTAQPHDGGAGALYVLLRR
ncbi:MAG TPA: Smr/MutS family protein [Myxococcaceae bacterium]|nr:Smr/MutS family protein [Myxococcaceae bacterium]